MKEKICSILVLCFALGAASYCSSSDLKVGDAKASLPVVRQLGDSITYGFGYTWVEDCVAVPFINQFYCPGPIPWGGGYRAWMTAMAAQSGGYEFVTQGYQYAASNYQQWGSNSYAHDGYPGWTNPFLARVALLGNTANVTLVHSGTNDVILGAALMAKDKSLTADTLAQEAQSNLFILINNLYATNPKSKLYIAQIIPIFEPAPNHANAREIWKKYNALIETNWKNLPAEVQANAALVNMSAILQAEDYDYKNPGAKNPTPTDGVHPNYIGYKKMACTWIKAIRGQKQTPNNPCFGYSLKELQEKAAANDKGKLPPEEVVERILKGH